MGVESKTASLTDGIEGAEEKLQEYRDKLPLPEGTAGVIVGEGDRIVGLDLFDSPETLASIWPRRAGAYFFDALRNRSRQTRTSRVLAKRFVERVATWTRPAATRLGLGDQLEIDGEGTVGAALLFAGRVCHVSAFGGS
jgi:hypothetical protein